jgi:hypothetical protein
MSAKRKSGPRKWGRLLVTAETYEFLSNLGRKGASGRETPERRSRADAKHSNVGVKTLARKRCSENPSSGVAVNG